MPFFVVGLTCNPRAVSRRPLAFRALSTLWGVLAGDCPPSGILQPQGPPTPRKARPTPIALLPFRREAMLIRLSFWVDPI